MKRTLVAVALAALALAGCRQSTHHVTPSASSAVRGDEAQAEQIVQKCLPSNDVLLANKVVFRKTVNCIVPNDPVARQKFETCVSAAVSKDALTKSGRALLNHDIDACAVLYAGKGNVR